MSSMLPIFYGEMPETASAPPRRRADESGSGSERALGAADGDVRGVKRKRVLTEARKEQNREAQRLFRQRQRDRRQKLREELKRPAKQPELRPRVNDEPSNPSGSNIGCGGTSSSGDIPNSTSSSSPCALTDEDHAVDIQLVPHSLVTETLRAYVPDAMANAIEFLPTTVFGACLHNAVALGVDLSDLASCGPEGISPFYRPSTPADDPAALFSFAMLSLTRQPPPNLLPTLTQILIPHHPSFDLIPFPHLRDQAIMLSAAMPQVFNIWELKLDIYQRGGLVMLKKRRGSDGKMKSCQPWEMSSWVAQPWFLRKWSMVVVGDREQLSKDIPPETEESGPYPPLLGLSR